MKNRRGMSAVLLVVVVSGFLVWLSGRLGQTREVLATSGTIEATEVPVASEVAGKVLAVLVEEGQEVKAGDLLVQLDDEALRLQLAQAEGALKLAQARLAEAQAGPRSAQVRQAEELARQAAAALDGAQKNYEVVKQLFDQGVVPKVQMDSAATQLEAARAQAEAAQAQLDLVRQGATPEQVQQLEAAVDQAEAAVNLAKFNLERANVKAPVSGVVVRRLVEPGALVAPGAPLITLANLNDLWLRVYVPEDQLNLVKLGMPVEVKVDSFPNRKFRAQVSYISNQAEFTPRNVQTKEERATTVYAVKLRLLEGLRGELKPGMPADVTFGVSEGE